MHVLKSHSAESVTQVSLATRAHGFVTFVQWEEADFDKERLKVFNPSWVCGLEGFVAGLEDHCSHLGQGVT